MAAYAALVSLMRIIDKLRLHPHPPISLHKIQVESLTGNISFLQEFLEAYNPNLDFSTEADPLETRIADAAYAAEDVIESHIVDHITNENISSDGLYEGLEKVIQDMASIQKDAMDITEKMEVQHHQLTKSTPPLSFRSTSIVRNSSSMVGVDDVLRQMKDKLTSDYHHLQIIPIVGMGGSGKTTLASNIYRDPLIQEHFHVHAWATISQEYSILGIFSEVPRNLQNNEVGQHLRENALGDMLHKYLFGRKYLIVMDDMWNVEAWIKVRRFFPDNKNGSRIVITTRLSNLTSEITDSNRLEMTLLDEDSSWDLLSKTVFGENGCPLELEEIGKKIASSCKGLPLSIVVVGGFLAKSKHTREFWEYIAENLNSIVNSVEDESCLRILHMSYKQLPVYLKPCFLYMGVFREDKVIRVSKLTRLWVAEGFLKPIKGKSLEEIAKEYLKDLTDRNLILIHKLGLSGSIKQCKMHDLLRELCLKKAEKERFYIVARQHGVKLITQRRIVISNTSQKEDIDALQSVSLARSLIWDRAEDLPSLNLRLLRIFDCWKGIKTENMFHLVNSRYLGNIVIKEENSFFSLNRFWNLEMLDISVSTLLNMTTEIWCMPQIRHVVCMHGYLPDPPSGSQNDIVLRNLHKLVGILDFKCSEEVVKRTPNLKKLVLVYRGGTPDGWSRLNSLACLHKLVSLNCRIFSVRALSGLDSINFAQSLKRLDLEIRYSECWEDILEKIGTLPLLEKFTLKKGFFEQGKWETAEGRFQTLKYLHVYKCNLKEWTMESSHFPRLEHLLFSKLKELEEIPSEVAEIPTLGSIELKFCSEPLAISARRIVEEQEESFGEAAIQVRLIVENRNEAVESLASHPNIRVETSPY